MLSSLLLAGIALPLTFAFPTLTPNVRLPGIKWPRQENNTTEDDTCNLASLQQPASTLTPPGADVSLVLIALGHGTQNYSCASETATPTAIGAVADLFNASCAVASGSTSLGSIAEDAAAIGAHFFVDNTTPDFDIVGLGNTQAKKVESMAAPQATNVPWLKLDAQAQGTTSAVKNIYRLQTVGGVAPKDCTGHKAGDVVTVEYEAQYWIYAITEVVEARRRKRGVGL
ncbi:hypothetical protein K505DRAFT_327968 [Melanomma pulvis-pyrius CBS 109.77]|uniref:Malate dehydrogenase n=1 Tax=Melanomma pulvis-pyrius CBS 109.77 TaxID=1314802 RepID=A0A6A6X0Y2_9PLEO|nr:hypothetical protein K505DRAFT_327968 [Melanomma pulvis-pyrius CBS 109.77]